MRAWRVAAVLAVVSSVVVLAPAGTSTASAATFSDVPDGHPFADDIGWLVDEGVTTGFPDNTFRPTVGVSRQAMAAFLYRFANQGVTERPTCTEDAFTDVPANHGFCGEIAWLAQTGVTTGFPDGTFGGDRPVTRQAMAAFLHRFANKAAASAPGCVSAAFSDVPQAHLFCGAVDWLADEGITGGFADGTFKPGLVVSRQAMAAFLHRLDDNGPGVNELAPEVEVIDETDTAFTVLDPTGQSTFDYTGTAPIGAGDVVVTMTPGGPFYGRVTSVDGDQVTTDPATLMDVVPNLDLGISIDAETGEADIDAPPDGEPVRVADAGGFGAALQPAGGGSGTASCSASVTGTVEADVVIDAGRFELNADWSALRGPELIEVLYTPTFSTSFHAGIEAPARCTYDTDLFDVDLPTIKFTIGPVPVWITHGIGADLEASVEVSGEAAFDAGFTAQGRLGVRWQNGEFILVKDFTNQLDAEPTLKVQAEARVDVPVSYEVRGYGVLGFDATVGPYAELVVDPFDTPWATLDAGLEGAVTAVFELSAGPIDWRKSHTFGPWELTRWRLWDTGDDPDEHPWPGPKITTTSLPDGIVGEPYTATLAATGGTAPLAWHVAGLPSGLTFDPTSNTISGSPAAMAESTIVVTVRDDAGWSSRRDLPLRSSHTIHLGGGTGPDGEVERPPSRPFPARIDVLPSGRLWLQDSSVVGCGVCGNGWAGLADPDGTLLWWSESLLSGNATSLGPVEDPDGNVYLFDERHVDTDAGLGRHNMLVSSVTEAGTLRWQAELVDVGGWEREDESVSDLARLDETASTLSWISEVGAGAGHWGAPWIISLDTDTGAEISRTAIEGPVPRQMTASTSQGYVGVDWLTGCTIRWFDRRGTSGSTADPDYPCAGYGRWYYASASPDGTIFTAPEAYWSHTEPSISRWTPDGNEAWRVELPLAVGSSCPLRALPNGNVLVGCDEAGLAFEERSAVDGSVVRTIPGGMDLNSFDATGSSVYAAPGRSEDDPEQSMTEVRLYRMGPLATTYSQTSVRRLLSTAEAEAGATITSAHLLAMNDGYVYVQYGLLEAGEAYPSTHLLAIPVAGAALPYATWHWMQVNPQP